MSGRHRHVYRARRDVRLTRGNVDADRGLSCEVHLDAVNVIAAGSLTRPGLDLEPVRYVFDLAGRWIGQTSGLVREAGVWGAGSVIVCRMECPCVRSARARDSGGERWDRDERTDEAPS